MAKGKSSLQETHFLGRCNTLCKSLRVRQRGPDTQGALLTRTGEMLHPLPIYTSLMGSWIGPEILTGDMRMNITWWSAVWASLVQVEATSRSSASFGVAVPEKMISRLLSARSCPSNIKIYFRYLVQPGQMSHGTISYLVSVSKFLSHERVRLRIVRTVYPLV